MSSEHKQKVAGSLVPGQTILPAARSEAPHVGVVLVTHNRPELMRRALDSIVGQVYAGRISVIVVHDRCAVDVTLTSADHHRRVQVMENARTPGLAGARNTGVLVLDSDFVAFCDDDDAWLPNKLAHQISAMEAKPEAEFASTAMLVDYDGRTTVRLAGNDEVSHNDLLRSRMSMVHSSSFLARRNALIRIGLVNESIPNSMCEDWDLLLRASQNGPIVHVDQPLIRVQWGDSSYFYGQWKIKNVAHLWMLENHTDILASAVGKGRVFGQLAFGHAALRQRRPALTWIARSLLANWREPRALLALAVVTGLVSDQRVVHRLQRRGRGI